MSAEKRTVLSFDETTASTVIILMMIVWAIFAPDSCKSCRDDFVDSARSTQGDSK